MYRRLRSSTTRSKNASKSPKNKSYRARDASMHSRSSRIGSKSDMDVDQPPKDKVNYDTIDERKSEESDISKNINLSSISEPQSLLSDQSSSEYSPLQKEKSLELEKECSSSYEVSPRLFHKEIRQKLLKLYRAGLSELDAIQKNITGLNKNTVYHHFQKLKQTRTSLRKSGSGRRCKLTNMHKQMIFEIIKSDHFLLLKK